MSPRRYLAFVCCSSLGFLFGLHDPLVAQSDKKFQIAPAFPSLPPMREVQSGTSFHEYYDILPNVASCYEGVLKESEKLKVLHKLNYVRSLHKLKPVLYKFENDAAMAKASLIMVANGTLTHSPDSTMKCWSALGYYGASTSNLWMGSSSQASEDQVDDYLIDYGVSSAGHRRWLIDPFLKYISFGRVDTENLAAGGIQVIHNETQELNELHPGFVAYPFESYPAELLEKTWYLSFSALANDNGVWTGSGVDFSQAQITVTQEDGQPMQVFEVEHDNIGYGLPNCLRWRVAALTDDVKYLVTIRNVKVLQNYKDYSYWFVSKNFQPALLSPTNFDNKAPLHPTFCWKAVDSKVAYDLQIARDPYFRDLVFNLNGIDSTCIRLTESVLSENTEYFWRVRAVDSAGIGHLWSPSWRFTTLNSHLSLLAPPNGAREVDPSVYFQWTALTAFDVDSYEFQAAHDSNLTSNYFTVDIPGTWSGFYFSRANPLQSGKSYFWRIKAKLAGGNQSLFSEVWRFTVKPATAVEAKADAIPTAYALAQNFPNPFKASTIIEFELPKEEYVALELFNLQGQRLKPLVHGRVRAGRHRIHLDTAGLPNGIYVYRMQTEETTFAKKLIILK